MLISNWHVRMLAFLRGYAADNQCPSIMREVIEARNLRSTAMATYDLSHLVEKGCFQRVPGIAKGLVLTEREGRMHCADLMVSETGRGAFLPTGLLVARQ